MLSVLKIVGNTAADGPGLRTSVYLAGCSHHCSGCHNPQSWNIDNGTWMKEEDVVSEIKSYKNKKVTITGGDPLYQGASTYNLISLLKKEGYNVWLYTGYVYEEIRKDTEDLPSNLILDLVDGLVDGPYIQELRDTSLRFRGSSNQRIFLRDSQGNLREDKDVYVK